jgi:hypothetical protein
MASFLDINHAWAAGTVCMFCVCLVYVLPDGVLGYMHGVLGYMQAHY